MSFLDFCLRCDTQTSGEAYCSQRCRLLDMDSNNTSPTVHSDSTHGYYGSNTGNTGGFFLPPAFDFSAYRPHSTWSGTTRSTAAASHRRTSATSAQRTGSTSAASSRPSSLYSLNGASASAAAGTTRSGDDRTTVTPSSSHGSLHHFSSSGDGRGMSRQARAELRDYTKSFDQVRDLRRRKGSS